MARLAVFFLAVLAWCSFNIFLALLSSDMSEVGVAWVSLLSALFGVPVLVYTAIADGLAGVIAPRRPTLCFLALVVLGILGFYAFIELGGGAPENKRAALAQIIPGFGPPTLAVIAIYTIANILRSRRRRVENRSAPPA